MKIRFLFLLALLAVLFPACKTDFEVYAPEKEIWAVYSVLDPEKDIQYVRVSSLFQVKGDALVYAAETDLSVEGLSVKLVGGGNTWTATQVDSFLLEDGIFYPWITIYKLTTDGSPGNPVITPGQEYTLTLNRPDTGTNLSAKTKVPNGARLVESLSLRSGGGNTKCLPILKFENDVNVKFQRGDNASSYELRIKLKYEKNGVRDSITWGPTDPFDENKGCTAGSNERCYKLAENSMVGFWANTMVPGANTLYTYDTGDSCFSPEPLSKALEFQLVAIDSGLTRYMTANNPKYTDFTGAKPEYTNFSGNIGVVGIFGSISTERKYAMMSQCSAWMLGLNGIPRPNGCNPL